MCQAWERSRHSVVTTANLLRRAGAGSPATADEPTMPAPTALTKLRLEIMATPLRAPTAVFREVRVVHPADSPGDKLYSIALPTPCRAPRRHASPPQSHPPRHPPPRHPPPRRTPLRP